MDHFAASAARYDDWFEQPLGKVVFQLEKRLFLTMAQPRSGERALDAGCGTGRLAMILAEQGLRVTGLDLSEPMLDVAREKLRPYPNVDLIQSPVERMPLPSDYYHLVVAFTVLEFTTDAAPAVRELWRTVRPGGRLVIAVLNAWSPWAWRRRAHAQRHGGVFAGAHFFSPPELVSLITRQTGSQPQWQSSVFIPPVTSEPFLKSAESLELWGSRLFRPFGALLVARADKVLARSYVRCELPPRLGKIVQPDSL